LQRSYKPYALDSSCTVKRSVHVLCGLVKGSFVGSLHADDHDGTEFNSRFQFFIVNGSDNKFHVDITTGKLSVQINSKLDKEAQDNYNITIMAIDQGAPPLTGTTVFEVTLIDVNDELPEFEQNSYTKAIYENKTKEVGVPFITCNATDPDEDSDLLYSIFRYTGTDEDGNDVNETLIQVNLLEYM